MSPLEIRHRANVTGKVSDELTGKPIGGAELELSGGARGTMRARSRPDGLFAFVDVPDGAYELAASLPESFKRYAASSQSVRVPAAEPPAAVQTPAERKRKLQPAASRESAASGGFGEPLHILLRPTTVSGRIVDQEGLGIALAFVRLRGSPEYCYTNPSGDYVLAGVEPGKEGRELLVSARGYAPGHKEVKLKEAGQQIKLADIGLELERK